jgi:hypothetical protein
VDKALARAEGFASRYATTPKPAEPSSTETVSTIE